MDSAVDVFNTVEVGLWLVLAIVLAAYGQRRKVWRRQCWSAAALFIAFAMTDVVELQTGAWWRPWWLLVAKALCLLGLVSIGLSARAVSRRQRSARVS